MYFVEEYRQWLLENSEIKKFGESLKFDILSHGVGRIPAGTVMVFASLGRDYMMFQTLQDIVLTSSLKDTYLIGYEVGSIVFEKGVGELIPTIRFRNCRMPTIGEYNEYMRKATV